MRSDSIKSILKLTLDRPKALNALNKDMIAELMSKVEVFYSMHNFSLTRIQMYAK